MSLRDYFAAQALAGLFSNPSLDVHSHENPERQIAIAAYGVADAMIKERSK
jgi:hypothetical protein